MSLQVWLPLNGNLQNKGLSDISVTNYGATVNKSGKIGKCYSFDGTNDYLQITNYHMSNLVEYSIACWVYPTSDVDYLFLVRGDGQHRIRLSGDGLMFRDTKNSSQRIIPWNYTFIANTWTHVCCTYKLGEIFLYCNGVQTNHNTSYAHSNSQTNANNTEIRIGRQQSSTSDHYFSGKINDFRIYNHALSLKEIKEIAKGLVLHYPLDNNGLGKINPNLLKNTRKTSGSAASGITRTITEEGYVKIIANSSNSNWVTFYCNNTLPIVKGDTFTFSVKIKSEDSIKKPTVYFQSGMGYYSMAGTMSSNWSIIYYTGTWTIDNLQTNIHMGFSSSPGTYYIEYIKLELGTQATPWCPNENDQLYDILGYNQSIMYDTSGYLQNGTLNGTFENSMDTPRYSASQKFTGTNYISLPSPCEEVKTVSLWVKWDTIPSGQSVVFVDYKSKLGFGLMSTGILCSTSGPGNSYTFSKANIVANTWYHFVIINPGAVTSVDRKLYINGVEQTHTSSASNWTYTIDQLQLGKRSTTSDGFKGLISDFRMYSSVLNEEDILELYHTSAMIDKNQNIYIREIRE